MYRRARNQFSSLYSLKHASLYLTSIAARSRNVLQQEHSTIRGPGTFGKNNTIFIHDLSSMFFLTLIEALLYTSVKEMKLDSNIRH